MTELKRSASPVDEENLRSISSKRQKVDLTMSNKERKEKFGERIAALQQLVSPYGKTDTASVLLEAMDYIKFLHEQVKVLSAPYLHNTLIDTMEIIGLVHGHLRHECIDRCLHKHIVRRDCEVKEGGGALLHLKAHLELKDKDQGHGQYSLRSKGLCLVPTSYTAGLPRSNGADIWAPTKSSSPRF